MVFLGGAVLANIVRFPACLTENLAYMRTNRANQMADKEDMWISKQEWQEQGPRALEKLGKR